MSNDPSVQRGKAAQGIPTIGPGGMETPASILGTQDRIRRQEEEHRTGTGANIHPVRAPAPTTTPISGAGHSLNRAEEARLSFYSQVPTAERWTLARSQAPKLHDNAPLTKAEQARYATLKKSDAWWKSRVVTNFTTPAPRECEKALKAYAQSAFDAAERDVKLAAELRSIAPHVQWETANENATKRYEMARVEAWQAGQRRKRLVKTAIIWSFAAPAILVFAALMFGAIFP